MVTEFGSAGATQNPDIIARFHDVFSREATEQLEGVVDSILEKDGKIARMRINPAKNNLSEPDRSKRRITLLFQDLSYENCHPIPVRTEFELGDYVKVIDSRRWYGSNMEGVPAILNETSGVLYVFDYKNR